MRIIVHDYGGYPFSVQLARALADRDHEVLYLYSRGFVTPKGPMEPRDTDSPTFSIHALGIRENATRTATPRRLLQEREYGARLAQRIAEFEPDVVISANCPLDSQAVALRAAKEMGAAFVFWMQDVYSQAVRRLLEKRMAIIGRVAGARFARLERRLVLTADAVVPISAAFLPILDDWGVAASRICVIPNWAPLDAAGPADKTNQWSREHGLDEVFVLAYTGTLGRKHNPGLLATLARELPTTRVVVVSEGVGADLLLRQADQPPNLELMPLQPAYQLAQVLGTADVLVALLEEDAGEFSVPSKVLTYLAAGRPILAAIPRTNLAAHTIADARAGIVVEPDNTAGLVAAARDLMQDSDARSRLGKNAREYAMRTFAISSIADQFESILTGAALHTASASQAPRREVSQ
jgi:glycosyltransferase involved in cell wall biosynthesis